MRAITDQLKMTKEGIRCVMYEDTRYKCYVTRSGYFMSKKSREKNKHTEELGILWFFLEAMNFSQEKRNRKKAKWFYAKPQ